MKTFQFLLFTIIILTFTCCNETNTSKIDDSKPIVNQSEYYQLKVYNFNTDNQIAITDKYLEKAYLPGLKRLGIKNIGVFKAISNKLDSIKKTYVLIPFASIEQFLTLEDKLNKDSDYLLAASDYKNATYDKPPYLRIESTLMKAFKDMPHMQPSKIETPRTERIYELRSYESPTEQYYKNKVDMFNAGGEVKLFKELEFNAVFYAEVISGHEMPNLMYMTTFTNKNSRDSHWKAFGDSPKWKELSSKVEYKNNVSRANIMFLYPTEYSDY